MQYKFIRLIFGSISIVLSLSAYDKELNAQAVVKLKNAIEQAPHFLNCEILQICCNNYRPILNKDDYYNTLAILDEQCQKRRVYYRKKMFTRETLLQKENLINEFRKNSVLILESIKNKN